MISGIRIGSRSDIPIIRSIAHGTWPHAYKGIISDDQISYMLDLMYSVDSLEKQMGELNHRFYLASDSLNDVGFASVGKVEDNCFKLHKLYVLTSVKGTGYGKKLLDTVIEASREQGGKELILQVNRHNPSFHFYVKKGFEIREELIFEIGNGYVMDDYILTKTI